MATNSIGLVIGCLIIFGIAVSSLCGDADPVPTFDSHESQVTSVAGSTAVLPCSVTFLGNYRVVWLAPSRLVLTVDDRRVVDDVRMSIERPFTQEWNLHIRNVKVSDEGEYKCTALYFRHHMSKTKVVNLIVTESPLMIDGSVDLTVKEGEPVKLWCNATGRPDPVVTWFKKDVDSGESKEMGTGSELEILKVTRDDDGSWECSASNGVLPVATRQIKLVVSYKPMVSLVPKVSKRPGEEVILVCQIKGNPSPLLTWIKAGKPIISSERYRIEPLQLLQLPFSYLKISDLTEEDFGEYTCRATNVVGSDERTVLLEKIPLFPEVQLDVAEVSVLVGTVAVLRCRVENLQNYSVVWRKRETLLSIGLFTYVDDYRITVKKSSASDWNLFIRDVKLTDSGKYSCSVTGGSAPKKTVRLVVKETTPLKNTKAVVTTASFYGHEGEPFTEEPSVNNKNAFSGILDYSDHVTATVGDDVLLWCEAGGLPKITWYRLFINKRNMRKEFLVQSDVLRLQSLSRQDADEYECLAVGKDGVTDSRHIKLNVEFPPEATVVYNSTMDNGKASNQIDCHITGNPLRYYAWYRNGELIQNGDKYEVHESKVDDFSILYTLALGVPILEEGGTFTCEVINQHGIASESIDLGIQE